MRTLALALGIAGLTSAAIGATPSSVANPAGIDWQPLSTILIARTETTVAQFRRFVDATGGVTEAERRGGGQEYVAGWQLRPGWTWRSPFGTPAADDEPAVHLTWHEARDFCRWAGARLPTDAEWVAAAYTEQRESPPAPFARGRTYAYPTGSRPTGANCRGDCDSGQAYDGRRHRPVTQSAPGVNGLHDMGGNAWEWVEQGQDAERRTRGGSWWYGAPQMRVDHLQGKPAGTAVVYIGFRCARDFMR